MCKRKSGLKGRHGETKPHYEQPSSSASWGKKRPSSEGSVSTRRDFERNEGKPAANTRSYVRGAQVRFASSSSSFVKPPFEKISLVCCQRRKGGENKLGGGNAGIRYVRKTRRAANTEIETTRLIALKMGLIRSCWSQLDIVHGTDESMKSSLASLILLVLRC